MYNINFSEIISTENVMYIGERLAIRAFKNFFPYAYTEVNSLYIGLIRDIERPNNTTHIFSDGYDFAQIASCFLCEHIGKELDDVLAVDKNGKPVTIKVACLRLIGREISVKLANTRRSVCIDDVYQQADIATLDAAKAEDDYTVVDKMIEEMKLTDKQKEVLLWRMAGQTIREVARTLSACYTTTRNRLVYVQKKYIDTFSEPKWRV